MIQIKDRNGIQDTLFFNPIKFDNEYGLQDSDQFEDFITWTSIILKSADLKINILDEIENTQNSSAYFFGYNNKLYYKVERLIKILIQNCFKKKPKKQSNKLHIQISYKLSKRLSATDKKLILNFQISNIDFLYPYSSFKISSIEKKTPKQQNKVFF